VISVGIIASNWLVIERLSVLLANDPTTSASAYECTNDIAAPYPAAWVIDRAHLVPPLSEWVRNIQSKSPTAKFLVLDRDRRDPMLLRLLALGIHGFMTHRDVGEHLRSALREICDGGLWFPGHILRKFVQHSTARRYQRKFGPLAITVREAQILELVERRLSNKEIATRLGVQESTVKYHLSNIFAKLEVQNRYELVSNQEEYVAA
jgi:DNA-binding NarL/FixJ family response regulator